MLTVCRNSAFDKTSFPLLLRLTSHADPISSFPPDFDPSKIKRRKGFKDPQQTVRLMAPFSMRCNKCGEYVCKLPFRVASACRPESRLTCGVGKGKKFNARKETAVGEEYYGIKIFRFYIVSLAAVQPQV